MKQILLTPLLAFTLLFGPACQSTAAKKTLLATGEAVNSAMNVYGSLYRADVLTPVEIQRVRTIHADFQKGYNAAVLAVNSDLSKMTPVEVGLLASGLLAVVFELRNAHPEIQVEQ